MFSEESSSPTVEVKKEGLRLLQTSPSLGTCIALPAIYHSVRYFEIEVVRNKGAVYVGWMEDSASRSFPVSNPNTSACVGSKPGTFAVNSQTGSVGHNNTWKNYFGRKIRKGDTVGSIIDLNEGFVRFILRSVATRQLPDVSPPPAFSIDPSKLYHAAISVKYAQTLVDARFDHPFALWDMVTEISKDSNLFALPTSLPFRLITPLYNPKLPLTLPSFESGQATLELQKATASYEFNTESLLLKSLPFETLLHIMSFIEVTDIPFAARVCRLFHESCSHYRLWNCLIERDFHFGMGISTQLYFDKLHANTDSGAMLTSSDALDSLQRNPYEKFLPTASEISKDRYRKRYNWKNAHFNVLPSIPTENSVNAMAYDSKDRVLFFCVEENLFSYRMDTGEVLESLLNTVGHIKWIVHAERYLVLGTDVGFVHVLDWNFGQVARFNEPHTRTLDAHLDHATSSLMILVGTKTKEIKLWKLSGAVPDDKREDASTTDSVPLATPELVWTNTTFHTKPLVQVSFTPQSKGKSFIGASSNGQISIWNATSSSSQGLIPEGDLPSAQWQMTPNVALAELTCMSISPEGWYGAVATSSGEIQLFDARFGTSSRNQLHLLPITSLGNLDNRTAARVGNARAQQGARNPANVANGNRSDKAILHIHYECGGKLVTTQDDNSVRYWNQRTGLGEWRHPTAGLTGSLLCCEEYLCFGLKNGRVALLDFDDVELTDTQLERSLNDRKSYLARRSRRPPPLLPTAKP